MHESAKSSAHTSYTHDTGSMHALQFELMNVFIAIIASQKIPLYNIVNVGIMNIFICLV